MAMITMILRLLIITCVISHAPISYGQFDCKEPFNAEIPSTAVLNYENNSSYQKYLHMLETMENLKTPTNNPEIILKSFVTNSSSILDQIQLSRKFIKDNNWKYPGLKESAARYKKYIKKHPEGTVGYITENEFKAIYLYSHISYAEINLLARNYELKDLPPNVIEFISTLNSAIEKLPSILRPMVLKRALRTDKKTVLNEIEKTDIFSFNQFLSTTFCGQGWRGEIYFNILIHKGSKAKDITQFSERPYENEAIFPLGVQFKLVNKYFDTQLKAMVFTIEEITSQHYTSI